MTPPRPGLAQAPDPVWLSTAACCTRSCCRSPHSAQTIPAGGTEGSGPLTLRLLGCLCVHARSMAAKRSPVPTKTASTLCISMRMRSVTTEPSGFPGGEESGPWARRPWVSRGPAPRVWELAVPPAHSSPASVPSQGLTGADALSQGRWWLLEPPAAWRARGERGSCDGTRAEPAAREQGECLRPRGRELTETGVCGGAGVRPPTDTEGAARRPCALCGGESEPQGTQTQAHSHGQ